MQTQIEEYLSWKATHTDTAYKSYKSALNNFAQIIKKRPSEITVNEIVKFTEEIKKHYSPQYVIYMLTIVRNFLSYVNNIEPCSTSPMMIKLPRPVYNRRVVVSLSDYILMCNVWDGRTFSSLRNKLIINLLWDTGARVSEVCAINLSDLDIQQRLCVVPTRKARGERYITWSDDTHTVLLKYLGVRLCMNSTNPLLIPLANRSKNRGRLDTRSVQRIIEETRRSAGITKKITPHSFRHGKAHKMLSQGATVKDIQVVLGHSENNPSASFKYLKLEQVELKKVIKKYI